MAKNEKSPLWQLAIAATIIVNRLSQGSTSAQIIPDATLGAERSVVNALDEMSDRIDGGAARGANLFHSFREFNIEAGRGAYFVNPAVIEYIFSRVTGNNPSHLLGTLGVLGNANLYFLNPNGIIFGPNASLDIRGSFTASTADSLVFPDGSEFSANQPQAAPILTVNVSVPTGLKFANEAPAGILNAGRLEVGQNLTLMGGTVVSTGQLMTPQGEVNIATIDANLPHYQTTVQFSETGQVLRQEVQVSDAEATAPRVKSLSELVAGSAEDLRLTINGTGQVELSGSGSLVEAGDIAITGNVGQSSLEAQRGNLNAAQNLTLVDTALGTVGDLQLLANDTVRIRDSEVQPFIAAAGGELLVQGNVGVDIFALNHGNSGLFSGGDMILRSDNPVIGDAHYWSGGNFRIEDSKSNLGDLKSIEDPIIRSLGDVNFNIYQGTSLHIITGGSVNAGIINITDVETGLAGIDFIQEAITLSDGTVVNIDGSQQATTDIRAGVKSEAIGTPGITGFDFPTDIFIDADFLASSPSTNEPATSADINISNIFIDSADGLVFITNQYNKNTSLPGGNIIVNQIATDDFAFSGDAGSVVIDSRGEINIENQILTNSSSGNAGDITLLAQNDIILDSGEIIGGNINILAKSLSLTEGALVFTSTTGTSDAGAIQITTTDSVSLSGKSSLDRPSAIVSRVEPDGEGNAGAIKITTSSLFLNDGAQIFSNTFGSGNAGTIQINANESVTLSGTPNGEDNSAILSLVGDDAEGDSGGIEIITGTLSLTNGARLDTTTFGEGNAGRIQITATDVVLLSKNSNIMSLVSSGAKGNSEGIEISANSLFLNQGLIGTNTIGVGNAGTIQIFVKDTIGLLGEPSLNLPSSITSTVDTEATGNGGDISIFATSLSLRDRAVIDASTQGEGNTGRIQITVSDTISLSGESMNVISSQVSSGAIGNSEGIKIETNSLSLIDGAQVTATTFGGGNAGAIQIMANDVISIAGESNQGVSSGVFAETASGGQAGDITITSPRLSLSEGAGIAAFTTAEGDGATITINAPQVVTVGTDSQLTVESSDSGRAGDIFITTDTLTIGTNAQLSATATETSTSTEGAGNINLNAASLNISGELGIFAETQSTVPAGTLTIQPNNNQPDLNLNFTDEGFISASTSASGEGGDINISAPESITISGQGRITVETSGSGNAGEIEIRAQQLNLSDGIDITASTSGIGQAGDINIIVDESIILEGEGTSILASTEAGSTGNGGNIFIDPETVIIRDGAIVAVNSQGTGTGGDIELQAGNLTLDSGTISAETLSTDGGNITLRIQDFLLLRNGSLISTTAGTALAGGNGGNIIIDAGFVIAIPEENSDIIANAFEGNGGNILITTQGLFGLAFRSELTDLSDITVSSALGIDGVFVLEDTGIDPTRGLEQLPNVVETIQLELGCRVGGEESRAAYFETGHGGTPQTPEEPLNADTVTDWIEIETPQIRTHHKGNQPGRFVADANSPTACQRN